MAEPKVQHAPSDRHTDDSLPNLYDPWGPLQTCSAIDMHSLDVIPDDI